MTEPDKGSGNLVDLGSQWFKTADREQGEARLAADPGFFADWSKRYPPGRAMTPEVRPSASHRVEAPLFSGMAATTMCLGATLKTGNLPALAAVCRVAL